MAITFPKDSNNKAGAIKVNADTVSFHVPIVIYRPDGITPLMDAVAVVFHNEASSAADGATIPVDGNKTLTIEIWGTSATRNVAFMGIGPSGTARPINGVNLTDFTVDVSTSGTGELWQFDVTGLTSVIMDLTAVSGGNVSVKGKLVA